MTHARGVCWCADPEPSPVPSLSDGRIQTIWCAACATYAIQGAPEDRSTPEEGSDDGARGAHGRGIIDRLVRLGGGPGGQDRGRLLDIGCHTGSMMLVAREAGFRPEGVEMSPTLAPRARERTGMTIHDRPVEEADLDPEAFAAVIMSHVLEHIPDPLAILRRIHGLLVEGGLLYIEVPNGAWPLGRFFYRLRWNGLTAPGHLWLFTPTSLRRLAARVGFEVVEVESWSVPILAPGLKGILKRSVFALLDAVAEREFLAVVLAKRGTAGEGT